MACLLDPSGIRQRGPPQPKLPELHGGQTQVDQSVCRERPALGSRAACPRHGVQVDENKAEAEFSKGVLTIRLPKSAETQAQRKRIRIRSAQAGAPTRGFAWGTRAPAKGTGSEA